MIKITSKGEWEKTRNFLNRILRNDHLSDFAQYGELGVVALERANPKDSGLSSNSWGYSIINSKNFPGISWHNTDIEGNQQVVILIQYGHGTKSGTWVQGRDFINPAMRPVFDQIAEDVWKKVNS